jgi:hypothetical protein
MIYVNIAKLKLTKARRKKLSTLSKELVKKDSQERSAFVESNREQSWGNRDLLKSLRRLVGNKCWYTEVPLEGADPNVDHFRPKGRVREIDDNLSNTGSESEGYWWLAFEAGNYRLCCMHSNQRRVDEGTAGGKWDYFPVLGERATAKTPIGAIVENTLVLDPCSVTDVELLYFDPDGNPGPSERADLSPDPDDKRRVKTTVWLFHLDKSELVGRRSGHITELHALLGNADAQHHLWRRSEKINHQARIAFNAELSKIRGRLEPESPFAGVLRSAARAAITDYPWLTEFNIV